MLTILISNWKSILIGLIIVFVLGTFAYQKYEITSLTQDNIILKQNIKTLQNGLDIADASIETCNNGKNALEQTIKDLNTTHEDTLSKVTTIDLTFKSALNEVLIKKEQISDVKKPTVTKDEKMVKKYLQKGSMPEFLVMSKEKSDEVIDLYNNLFSPFIKP